MTHTTQPPMTPVPAALQQALDDYDRAQQRLAQLVEQHPNHPHADKWRAMLANCPPDSGDA